jgi:hypothetical protein
MNEGESRAMRRSWRDDVGVWLALLLVAVGLGLVDRSFAIWRNDARNFPHANGVYPVDAELVHDTVGPLERKFQRHGILGTMAGGGLVLFVAGAFLLIREGGRFGRADAIDGAL